MFKFYPKLLCLLFNIILLINFDKILAQCGVAPTNGSVTISIANNIINTYYQGTSNAVAGTNSLTIGQVDTRGNSTQITAGDLVLIIQIQGADINSDNNNSYGDSVAGASAVGYLQTNLQAGYYEYNTVSSITGGNVTFSYGLANNYYNRDFTNTTSIQRYQVVRIPRYYDFKIKSGASVTCPAWNGSTGGIVVVDVDDKFTLNGAIDVSFKGFRGGGGKNMTGSTAGNSNGSGPLTNTDFRWNSPVTTAANLTGGAKGEGIAGTPAYYFTYATTLTSTNTVEGYINGSIGRGAPANAGGGATDGDPLGSNQYNSGGGGGGNGGDGGNGGSGWHGTSGGDLNTYPTGGYGGSAFSQRSLGRFCFGGGGGAGSANNSITSNEYSCSGGGGGGIVITRAKVYAGNGSVLANGSNAPGVTATYTPAQTDAAGGGGAGGSIIMVTTQTGLTGLNNIIASAVGGNGGDMANYYDYGPGGGGGGGFIISNGTFLSANISGGDNGQTRTDSTTGAVDNDYDATPGADGEVILLNGPPTLINSVNPTSPCGVLPVNLKTFDARWDNSTIDLEWEISDAINLTKFELEYSVDGNSFSRLSTIYYKDNVADYSYTHLTPTLSNFYRLKMTDNDGKFFYSKVLSIQKTYYQSKKMLVFPNPAYSDLTIKLTTGLNEKVNVDVIDNSGKTIINKEFTLLQGENYLSIDGIDKLPSAIYYVRVKSVSVDAVEKLIVNKNQENIVNKKAGF